jgi:uncharacterized protein YdhG (YjbR/CyaY superfamily)
MQTKFKEVNEYIQSFPIIQKELLTKMRITIKEAAPEAQEIISYGMPAYKFKGKALVYFAAYKNHIGFYATPTGHAAFKDELSIYKQGKGSVQFPIEKLLPLDLISRIVKFRMSIIANNYKY